MSFSSSLLTAYPTSYELSELASDDLVGRSSIGTYYGPRSSYINTSRYRSDDLSYRPIDFGSSTYRSTVYSHFPLTNYRPPSITDWRREIPAPYPYTTSNDIREYSESLGTSSNATTASSIAHSVLDHNQSSSSNKYSSYQTSYNRLFNDIERSPRMTTIWSPTTRSNVQTNEEKPIENHHSMPEPPVHTVRTKSEPELPKKVATPHLPPPSSPLPPPLRPRTPSNHEENNAERQLSSTEEEKHNSSADSRAQSVQTKKDEVANEELSQQSWSLKIDRLHTIQAQREKEKSKSSRALPNAAKTSAYQPSSKAVTARDPPPPDAAYQMRDPSYFDSLFDGNFVRRNTKLSQNQSPSHHHSFLVRNKPTTVSFSKPKTSVYPKYIPPRRPPTFEPAKVNINNNSNGTKKKEVVKQKKTVSPREDIHKDDSERFRDALSKFRTDRAEYQQREATESTAKRLTYGDYVRRSTKDDLLQNAVKPLPWSDFIDVKKGHLYSLTQEEKKELYHQSKSYGERVRFRNYALHQATKPQQPTQISTLWPIEDQEPDSNDEAAQEMTNVQHNARAQNDNDDDNGSKVSDGSNSSAATNRTFVKETGTENLPKNHKNHRVASTDQSSTVRASDDDTESASYYDSKHHKRPKHDTTTGTEGTDNEGDTSEQPSTPRRNFDSDDDLFTVREEKTLESLEGTRHKKR